MKEVEAFSVDRLLSEADEFDEEGWRQFLKVPTLRAGIYRLPKGAQDRQSPHKEDEVYYVISGKGILTTMTSTGKRELACSPGAILFVEAGVEHRFERIERELVLLVLFSSGAK